MKLQAYALLDEFFWHCVTKNGANDFDLILYDPLSNL